MRVYDQKNPGVENIPGFFTDSSLHTEVTMDFKQNENTLSLEKNTERMELSYVKNNIVHVKYGKDGHFSSDFSLIEDRAKNGTEKFTSEKINGYIKVTGGRITLNISDDLNITYLKTSDDSLLLKEAKKEFIEIPVMKHTTMGEEPVIDRVKTVDGERNFIKNLKEVEDHKALQGRLFFKFKDDEHIH